MTDSTGDLQGRTALVTGGGRGIGAAVVRLLAERGARVAVHYGRDREAAATVAAGLSGAGHCVLGADLGEPAAATGLVARAVDELGRLDILVNNAGIYEPHDVSEVDAATWQTTWRRTLAVNLDGPAQLIHAAVPALAEAGGGHIVNITSRGAFRGEPEAPAYGASKAALNSLSQSLAVKLAPLGIHVVAVAPGWVETDMTRAYLAGPEGEGILNQSPLGRTAVAAEIAEVVLLVVSGRADALTGGIIDVNCASYLRS